MKNEGFSAHRLSKAADNPREVAFAEQWDKENNDESWHWAVIEHLIPDVTERDRKVAATVIQWLGSPVGMAFLGDVLKRSPKLREEMLEEVAMAE